MASLYDAIAHLERAHLRQADPLVKAMVPEHQRVDPRTGKTETVKAYDNHRTRKTDPAKKGRKRKAEEELRGAAEKDASKPYADTNPHLVGAIKEANAAQAILRKYKPGTPMHQRAAARLEAAQDRIRAHVRGDAPPEAAKAMKKPSSKPAKKPKPKPEVKPAPTSAQLDEHSKKAVESLKASEDYWQSLLDNPNADPFHKDAKKALEISRRHRAMLEGHHQPSPPGTDPQGEKPKAGAPSLADQVEDLKESHEDAAPQESSSDGAQGSKDAGNKERTESSSKASDDASPQTPKLPTSKQRKASQTHGRALNQVLTDLRDGKTTHKEAVAALQDLMTQVAGDFKAGAITTEAHNVLGGRGKEVEEMLSKLKPKPKREKPEQVSFFGDLEPPNESSAGRGFDKLGKKLDRISNRIEKRTGRKPADKPTRKEEDN